MADSRLGLVASMVVRVVAEPCPDPDRAPQASSETGTGAGPRAGPRAGLRRGAGLGAAPGIAPGAEAGARSDSVATCWPAAVLVFACSGAAGGGVDGSTSQAVHTPSNETPVTTCHRATLCLVILGNWVGNGGNHGVRADYGHAHWACRILITGSHGHFHA